MLKVSTLQQTSLKIIAFIGIPVALSSAYGASCKIIWNASHNPSQIEAMYLESIRRFAGQLPKIFRFTVRNISV